MTVLRTDLRKRYNHPDILIQVDDSWVQLADWLPRYFTEQVQQGVHFVPGQLVQVGWMLLRIEDNAEGCLFVSEPDLKSMPIQWSVGATRTVRLLALHRAICDELCVNLEFCSLREALSTTTEVPPNNEFYLTRTEAEGSNSGWILHRHNEAELRLMSLYEAALINNAIIPFLALPTGSAVVRNEDRLTVSVGGLELSSESSPLFRHLATADNFLDRY